ncbi:MAG: siphovirus Gp157 family protein [Planctomycetota bacterium]
MPRTLLNITADLEAIDQLLAEAGGDVTDPSVCEAIEAWMSELDHDLKKKVDGYAAYLTELLARIALRKAEAKRLNERAKIDANAVAKLKERLLCGLKELGMKKVETDRYVVTVARNGGKQPLDISVPAEELPPRFTREVRSIEVNKDELRSALEAGEEVNGAILMDRGESLRIK